MKIKYFKLHLVYKISSIFFLFLIGCNKNEPIIPQVESPQETVESPEIKPEDRLPEFLVNTDGSAIVDEPKIDAQLTINTINGIDFEGKIGIEIRGKSSQMFPKKSYGFETRDNLNEDLDVSLLGFPEESDWILYGPYSDKTFIRNKLIYDLSRDIGRYASRCQFVELIVNDEYQGVYVFMEKLKRDNNRIDINKLKIDENSGEDLTGGYILKIDKSDNLISDTMYTDEDSFPSQYSTDANMGQSIRFLYEDPKWEEITTEQKIYISNYVNEFEDALASNEFMDAVLGYSNYIDVVSFIDFFLLNELSNNVDGYRLSTYMQKNKNEKLKMGPIWDFNLAFGNADYCSGGESNVWAYKFNERCEGDFWSVPFWWERLLEDPAFVLQLQQRWSELRSGVFTEASILGKIENYKTILTKSGAIDKNFKTWPIHGMYVWPNNYVGNSYSDDLGYLQDWVQDRLIWLDGAIAAL